MANRSAARSAHKVYIMSIKIFSPDLGKLIKFSTALSGDIGIAQKRGLVAAGFAAKSELRRWVETAGHGAWPKRHPFTLQFAKRPGTNQLIKRKQTRGAFFWLGGLARYSIRGNAATIGFAFEKKPQNFSSRLDKIIARIQAGATTAVTPKMTRFWGVSRFFGNQIGKDFFPLRKETAVLRLDPRPIENPVFALINNKSFSVFRNRFVTVLSNVTDLADSEFQGK